MGEEIHTALSKCLSSYEGQLESATIHDMDSILLEAVVEKCTNARFSLVFDRDVAVDHLRIVGKKLDTVKFGYHDNFNAEEPSLKPGCKKLSFTDHRPLEKFN